MNPIADRVINGSHGKLWIDGNLVAEIQNFDAQVEIQYADVNIANDGAAYRKQVGWTGSGTMAINHVYSRQINKLAKAIKSGKTVRSTVVGMLADPDSGGRETITLRDVTFNGLQLLKFEQKTITTEDIGFSFSDYDIQDTINT
ncbi:phage tail tube protein [Paenibacillus sp. NPDC093718]|uniref:phage tail tube protein n=1 Tax=Paenibacillus sp. NPDC093718 TaxID=3390601 RepID=UPI003CFF1279